MAESQYESKYEKLCEDCTKNESIGNKGCEMFRCQYMKKGDPESYCGCHKVFAKKYKKTITPLPKEMKN